MGAKVTKKEVLTEFRTQEILAAARRVMERRGGVEGATMEEIAQAAGVAKGTIYLYFASKEHLISALMSQVGENLRRELEAILTRPGSAWERLLGALQLCLDYLRRERLLFPVYFRDLPRWLSRANTPFQRIRQLEEEILAQLTGLFSQGISQGEFVAADPRLLACLFRGLIRGVGYYQWQEAPEIPLTEAEPVLRALLGGLRRPRASQEVLSS
ncbi:MAG: TetR/AcrR family transcriptional regulator [Syntrophobacterales bacterium]|nr:TetR/AcrR family transcriptional regulator [Syntrophobacterales bacterium]